MPSLAGRLMSVSVILSLRQSASADFFRDRPQIIEEGSNEPEQFLSGRGERKRTPLEQRHAEKIFELQNLAAHGRLLNAVRNVADRVADPTVPGHVIKQFQMMN